MLLPPKNIAQELATGLIRQADLSSIQNTLFNISKWVLGLFGAKDLAIFFDHQNQTFSSLASVRSELKDEVGKRILELWRSEGLHAAINKEVVNNLRPISYSSYSWPFPSFSFFSENKEISMPRVYTLFIPFSSEMIITVQGEQMFAGYLVAMFDDFIEITDKILELIVTLPNLVSEFIAAYFRSIDNSDDLATSFAHDLKYFLLVNQELIKELTEHKVPAQEVTLQKMTRALTRISHQANSLLLISKEQKGVLQVCPLLTSINEIAQEAVQEVEPLFQAANLNLEINLSNDLPQCEIDPAIFPSVIHNLLHNALKYSKPDGKVSLETKMNSQQQVTLIISDQGIGIPEQERELVFTKNYRASNVEKTEGSGIGLYLVRKIVEAHKGQIVIDDQQEPGTRFVVELPIGCRE